MSDYHKPVMLSEVLEFLDPQSGETIADFTLGGGGHSLEIVKRLLPDGRLIGIDQDDEALAEVAGRLSGYSANVILRKGNFSEIEDIVRELGIDSLDGVLMDLGVSSHQLDQPERGFSFRYDAPLDMRMDPSGPTTAADLVNSLSERDLADVIWRYGEERWSRRIAKFIVERRKRQRIRTTTDLVDVILAAIPAGARPEKIHAATRTFQALRVAVNRELEVLEQGLDAAVKLLAPGGRLVVMAYQSLEDKLTKAVFARHTGRCACPPGFPVCACGAEKRLKILTKHPVVPSDEEVRENPRARSAKLRAAERV